MPGFRKVTVALMVVAIVAVAQARGQPASVVIEQREKVRWEYKLNLPPPPGFVYGLERYAPKTFWERRRLQVQLSRLLTMVSKRWVPDTTSFPVLIARLNRLTRDQQNRALLYILAGPVALKTQGVLKRFAHRHRIPLVEPSSQGIRSKPFGLSKLIRAWYEIRLNRYAYTYLQLPRWRATLYRAQSPTYHSDGLWMSLGGRWGLSVQKSGGRTWRSESLTLSRYGRGSWFYAQLDHITTRWRRYWRFALRWEWVGLPQSVR